MTSILQEEMQAAETDLNKYDEIIKGLKKKYGNGDLDIGKMTNELSEQFDFLKILEVHKKSCFLFLKVSSI